LGSLVAIERSLKILATTLPSHLLAQRKECFTVALLMYQSIGIQTSVKPPFLAAVWISQTYIIIIIIYNYIILFIVTL
jgi:hypothetical protein